MKLHFFGTISSTFDKAFELAKVGRLDVWDCVFAQMQTAGRGQLRSKWVSQPGNLFLSIRLPENEPFNTSAGAVAIGALCVDVLRTELNFPVYLKWPNDVVIFKQEKWIKCGGILLEDHGNILIAGIGLNIVSAPKMEELDKGNAFEPGFIENAPDKNTPVSSFELGRILVAGMKKQAQKDDFIYHWLEWANKYLALKGAQVCIADQNDESCGTFLGIAKNGVCILRAGDRENCFTHGVLRQKR